MWLLCLVLDVSLLDRDLALSGDVIEINHYCPRTTPFEHSHQVQLILWRGEEIYGYENFGSYHVKFLAVGDEISDRIHRYHVSHRNGLTRLRYWHGSHRLIEITAPVFRETWTMHDPEFLARRNGEMAGHSLLSHRRRE